MSQRASLPQEAMSITPGYSWRIDLDVKFDGERPTDWPDWTVRLHIWGGEFQKTLTNGSGVTYESTDIGGVEAVVPVITLTGAETAEMAAVTDVIYYLVDIRAPAGEAEDYFAGSFKRLPGPPVGMLS